MTSLQGRQTVLLVDDTPENLAVLNGILSPIYKVRFATQGQKALEMARSDTPPDLILLDVMMPGMSGHEVCRELKDDPRTRQIPVIFVTALGDVLDEQAGFALGAKLVFPEKDVFIIYGDGSAGYSLMEYDTFVRHNLPVISVIGNDAGWTQIARDQVDFLKSDCAVCLAHSDYEMIGKAFGSEGKRVESIEAFAATAAEAIEKSRKGISQYTCGAVRAQHGGKCGAELYLATQGQHYRFDCFFTLD